MSLLVLSLAFAALSAPAAAACPPVERVQGPPVYVILHGYGGGPVARPLTQTDDDLVHMARLFRPMAPALIRVHGEPTPLARLRFGQTLRPATWDALIGSVEEVRAAIERQPAAPRPRVYVYLSGHGAIGRWGRLTTFTEPTGDGPGRDGRLDATLIAEHIIAPLAAGADVHLIADTCHSHGLVETRPPYSRQKIEPGPRFEQVPLHAFVERFPTAGALMAARDKAWGSGDYTGGVFSHAVRSLALGPGDLDRDGVITYGEMAVALPEAIRGRTRLPAPRVLAPHLDPDRPFIDWRATPAARVCLPGGIVGKRFLVDTRVLWASLRFDGAPLPVWLAPGRIFELAGVGVDSRYFRAADGPAAFGVRSPRLPPAGRAEPAAPAGQPARSDPSPGGEPPAPDAEPPMYWEPLPKLFDRPITEATASRPPPFEYGSRVSVGGALLAGGSMLPPDALTGLPIVAPHADLEVRVGFGRHRVLAVASYAWWTIPRKPHVVSEVTGHRLGSRAGYGLLVEESRFDLSVDGLVGVHRLWHHTARGPRYAHVGEFALRLAFAAPFDAWSRLGTRIDFDLGGIWSGDWVGPSARLLVGLDVESLIE